MILSTNKRIISLGQDYSAGENIGIYDHTISSRNWTPDITYASESAVQRANEYTNTQISALSGEVSSEVSQLGSEIDYISGVALTAHQSLEGYLTKASGDEYYQPIGSYATVSQLESTSGEIVNLIPNIEGLATEEYVNEQTSGKADKSEIPDVSQFITNVSAEQTYQPIGNYLSSNALEGYATQDWVGEQGYLTSVSIPESATWQDVSTTVQTNSAQWAEGGTGGDPEVNSFVYNNSATINEVNTSYQTNSGNFLTAAPSDMATTGDVAELAQTISETYQTKGDYLVRSDSANFYPTSNPSGFITGVDLSNYYTKDETSGKEELADAFANIPVGNPEVNAYVTSNSASINESTNLVQSNSSTWNDVTAYQSNSASYLTAHQSLDGYATTSELEQVSGDITALIPTDYATTAQVDDLSGAIDYVSANAGAVITKYTSAYSPLIQPYGGYVINTLNGSALSALVSYSADRANYATNSNNANIAGTAQYVNVTNVKNQGFVRNLSSEYGTISVVRNNIIDSTNSAILRTGYEGFTSALEGDTIGPAQEYGTRTFSWNNSLPNTTFNCNTNYPPPNSIIYYSANTNLTGEIELPDEPNTKVNIDVPNVTALSLWCNGWIGLKDIVLSAADTFETVVGELAWASAIPTYQYDNANKISAINGSALAVGGGVTGEFVPQSAFNELKQSYETLSSLFATYSGQWLLPNEGV